MGLSPGGQGVGFGIERLERFLPGAVAAAVAAFGIGFLDAPGISQHRAQQVGSRGGAPDPPFESLRDQARQQAGMVDMGVGQDHRVDLLRIEGKVLAIQGFQAARSLEQAAIDQHPRAAQRELHARTCHGPRRSVESQRQFPVHDRMVRVFRGLANPF